MSALTEFQIYAAIKQCAATAEMNEARGKPRAAAASRARADQYRQELRERIVGMLARGERIPDAFVTEEAARG